MPIAFKKSGLVVSGTGVTVADVNLGGCRDPRLLIRNAAGIVSGAQVLVKSAQADDGAPVDVTWEPLDEGSSTQLVIAGPVEWLEVQLDGDGEADVAIQTGLEP